MSTLVSRLRRQVLRLLERLLRARIYRRDPYGSFYDELATIPGWTGEPVIFDVGANDGRTVRRLRRLMPKARIHAFEPVRAAFALLQQQVARDARTSAHMLALGERAERKEIHVGENLTMSSFHDGWSPSSTTETVEVSTVDAFLQARRIPHLHFLKIDTEGFELPVLRGAVNALRDGRIDFIQAEVRFDQPPSKAGEVGRAGLDGVRAFLSPLGYRVHGFYNFSREPCRTAISEAAGDRPSAVRSVLAYCDVVFVRCEPPGEGRGEEQAAQASTAPVAP